MKYYTYFTLNELKCKCGKCNSTGLEMDDEFMERIKILREECGFPFIVSSAYRCPDYNAQKSKTGFDGPHTTGKAMDILVQGENAYILVKKALLHDFTGIGVNQKDDVSKRFIHLDILTAPDYPRPRIFSY